MTPRDVAIPSMKASADQVIKRNGFGQRRAFIVRDSSVRRDEIHTRPTDARNANGALRSTRFRAVQVSAQRSCFPV
jgi:hypothetical protein